MRTITNAMTMLLLLGACVQTRGPSIPEGMEAPDFTLSAANGTQVHLADVNDDHWTVLVFYRGDW